jgi:hypothetical protein
MYVIALIGIGLVLHGFLMLVLSAFRARFAWGMAVMFVPFAQFFFPIYHWDKARKPFSTFTFGMALWLGTAVVFGQGPLDEYWLNQVNLAQSAERFVNRLSGDKPMTLQERAERLIGKAKNIVAEKPIKNPSGKTFNAKNSKDYIGYNVRVTLYNGNIRNGRIISAHDEEVELQYTIGDKTMGSMTYNLEYDEIKSIEIVS